MLAVVKEVRVLGGTGLPSAKYSGKDRCRGSIAVNVVEAISFEVANQYLVNLLRDGYSRRF